MNFNNIIETILQESFRVNIANVPVLDGKRELYYVRADLQERKETTDIQRAATFYLWNSPPHITSKQTTWGWKYQGPNYDDAVQAYYNIAETFRLESGRNTSAEIRTTLDRMSKLSHIKGTWLVKGVDGGPTLNIDILHAYLGVDVDVDYYRIQGIHDITSDIDNNIIDW